MKLFHNIKGLVDRAALIADPPVASLLIWDAMSLYEQSAPSTVIGPAPQLKADIQLGLVIRGATDEAKLNGAADGLVLELDVTFFELTDPTAAATGSNIRLQHQSVVSIFKVEGELHWNNASVGPINPNAFVINAINDVQTLNFGTIYIQAFN